MVLKAGNGQDGLDIIASHQVDLVLTEVLMPGIDGFETCRRIKADERSRQIALSHHERWDRSGYPFGYSGERIPLAG